MDWLVPTVMVRNTEYQDSTFLRLVFYPDASLEHLIERGLKMVTSLSKLAALIQDGSVPAWLREAVNDKRSEILAALAENQPYTLAGPHGEEIIIRRTVEAAAAA